MPALHELQRDFAAALYTGITVEGVGNLAQLIVADGIEVRERLDIYRNNLSEGFRKALALEFPVVVRLVGEDYFRQLALDFMTAHPSRCGDLHHVGAPFAGFLATRFADGEYAYLIDVARLEWAVEECGIAPEAAHFDIESLRTMSVDHYATLRFELHPACRLVRSPYPILQIWQANQTPDDTGELIDLGGGGESVLVRRIQGGLELETLNVAQFALLEAFAAGIDLSVALEVARERDASFDLGAALRNFISSGVLIHAALPEPLRPEEHP